MKPQETEERIRSRWKVLDEMGQEGSELVQAGCGI